MGGQGSGNHYHWWRHPKKRAVEDCLAIDAGRLARAGVLRAGVRVAGSQRWDRAGGGGNSLGFVADTRDMDRPLLLLSYAVQAPPPGEPEDESYAVGLTTTVPRFGGLRWWFICTLVISKAPACAASVSSTCRPGAATSAAGTATS